jgi:hypothetical protein
MATARTAGPEADTGGRRQGSANDVRRLTGARGYAESRSELEALSASTQIPKDRRGGARRKGARHVVEA